MASLWLPIGRPLYAVPTDEREELLNRLYQLRVLMPGARSMEIQKLRDYVQWQEERAEEDARKALLRPAYQPKKLRQQDVIQGLREYYAHIEAKRENRKRLYLSAGTGQEA